MALARMRTRQEFYKLLKEQDPHTAITPHMIYTKLRSGEWPSTKVGNRRLLNVDLIFSILANPAEPHEEEPATHGIRRVK